MAAIPSPLDTARWIVATLFAAVLAVAALSDIRHRRIPNWTVLAVAALFGVWAFVGPAVSVVSSLAAAGIVLLTTGVLYAFGLLGAGDSKLMTAVALFAGLGHLVQFVLVTIIAGGVLALASLVIQQAQIFAIIRSESDFGRGIPYGVAIAVAGAVVMGSFIGAHV
jgi:prepilin peptidase CpaA